MGSEQRAQILDVNSWSFSTAHTGRLDSLAHYGWLSRWPEGITVKEYAIIMGSSHDAVTRAIKAGHLYAEQSPSGRTAPRIIPRNEILRLIDREALNVRLRIAFHAHIGSRIGKVFYDL